MARRNYSMCNKRGQTYNDEIFSQFGNMTYPSGRHIRDPWMSNRNANCAPFYSARIPTSISPLMHSGQTLANAINAFGSAVTHEDAEFDNGEAFTSYTGMDSQAAYTNCKWF